MRAEVPPGRFGYGVIAAGTVLSIISAVVPFYTAGYQRLFTVFTAGCTPDLVYGRVVYWSDPAIYIVPLVFTVLLVPLLVVAMRQPWRE